MLTDTAIASKLSSYRVVVLHGIVGNKKAPISGALMFSGSTYMFG